MFEQLHHDEVDALAVGNGLVVVRVSVENVVKLVLAFFRVKFEVLVTDFRTF